nr:MBL fold metallo-hydrolase [Candidatus Baldrarchaeota archaeon]
MEEVKVYVLADDYSGYDSKFLAQHGASYLIKMTRSGESVNILFDTGTYGNLILENMRLLDIDPKVIDMIVLSHCHYDHTKGLVEIVEKINKENFPIIAHPTVFRPHFCKEPVLTHIGMPFKYRKKVEELGGEWVLLRNPTEIAENIFVTGEVERVTEFEKTPTLKLYTLENGQLVEDDLKDDVSLVINMEKGIIVISGCSHAGIINITKHAIRITGSNEVRAVIGGFHLIDADEGRIRKTVDMLKQLETREIYTGHCTGLKAECLLLKEFGDSFKKLHAGMVITFR